MDVDVDEGVDDLRDIAKVEADQAAVSGLMALAVEAYGYDVCEADNCQS